MRFANTISPGFAANIITGTPEFFFVFLQNRHFPKNFLLIIKGDPIMNFLASLVQFLVLIPAALLCYLPMKSKLR